MKKKKTPRWIQHEWFWRHDICFRGCRCCQHCSYVQWELSCCGKLSKPSQVELRLVAVKRPRGPNSSSVNVRLCLDGKQVLGKSKQFFFSYIKCPPVFLQWHHLIFHIFHFRKTKTTKFNLGLTKVVRKAIQTILRKNEKKKKKIGIFIGFRVDGEKEFRLLPSTASLILLLLVPAHSRPLSGCRPRRHQLTAAHLQIDSPFFFQVGKQSNMSANWVTSSVRKSEVAKFTYSTYSKLKYVPTKYLYSMTSHLWSEQTCCFSVNYFWTLVKRPVLQPQFHLCFYNDSGIELHETHCTAFPLHGASSQWTELSTSLGIFWTALP